MGSRFFMLQLLLFHVFGIAFAKCIGRSNRIKRQQDRLLQALGRVENLRLIDAVSDIPIMNLTNGTIIDLAQQSASKFNIEALTVNGVVGSVRFGYNGKVNFRTVSTQPFAFCGMGVPLGNFLICNVLTLGQHNVTATPYSGSSANGTKGVSFQVSFTIINSTLPPPTKAPTKSPTKMPTKAPSKSPTKQPTKSPTSPPTKQPTKQPTKVPSNHPTNAPLNVMPPSILPNCSSPQFIDASWSFFNPSYPFAVNEGHGVLIGDEVVVFGGFTNSYMSATNQTYARNVTETVGIWRRMDDMPVALGLTHMASVLVGSKIYACGGYVGAHPGPHTATCFVYDHSQPAGQQWARFADIPNGGTAGAGMIFDTSRNALYYAGGGQRLVAGSALADDVNNTWKYSLANPGAGWLASTAIPYAANHMSAVTHRDSLGLERHFFLGGQISEFEAQGNLADNFEFLAASETWVRRSSLLFPRSHAAESTRAYKCGFVVAGGSIQSSTTIKNRTDDVSFYDIYRDTWTSIGKLPQIVATPIVNIHPNGYMYYLYGSTGKYRRRRIE